jgi:hypothetical protein
MQSARHAEQSFFPLDEELELLPGNLTPFTQECLVRLGAWIPFGRVVEILKDMLGVQISPAQVRRVTEGAGAAYVEVQTREAERIEREAPAAPAGSEKMLISVDGAMVPLRQGEWAEVKTLVIGEVQPAVVEKGEWVVHTQKRSYFSRLANAEQFEHLTLVEIQRRGVENSAQVAAVMDGAEWEQGFIDYHCPRAVRILDFPHAGQRIGQIGQALWGEGNPQSNQWITERLHTLKHQGPAEILTELSVLKEQHPQIEVIDDNLNYLANRQGQMQYPDFQAQGWPIGSGIVESGNKLVVEARLKGAGMHWRRENVDPMLGLRNIICSERWLTEWPIIVRQLRQQAREQRKQNRKKRRLAKLSPPAEINAISVTEQIKELPGKMPEPLPDKLKSAASKIPAANHPWRHSPIGRVRYQPAKIARK